MHATVLNLLPLHHLRLTSRKRNRLHPQHNVRIVTAASLFDGHDAAINIMRRIMQRSGCEVIHLGHDRR